MLAVAPVLWLMGAATPATAEVVDADASTNGGAKAEATLRVLSAGGGDGMDIQIVADLAAVLDDAERLRIVPIIGNGGRRNIDDLLSEPPLADVAIVQADALNSVTDARRPGGERELFYIAKLFNEEVYVVARADIDSLASLAGKKVAIGVAGSGAAVTARAIFAALAIPIEPLSLEPADARERLRTGEIAAMVTVGGKPADAGPASAGAVADGGANGGRLHLLSIPVNDALLADYVPSALDHDDDPELIASGETVETISVPAIMVVAGADPGSGRGLPVAAFVNAFFGNFAKFQTPPRHPKWREVNLGANVAGWRRLPVAVDWVRINMATAEEKKLRQAFDDILRFLAKEGVRPGAAPLGERERAALFWRFVDWRAAQATP